MLAVFDTNIVIDALNGVEQADTEYSRFERVLISRITWMEVLVGAEGDDTELRDFMESHFEIIPLDLPVAETAVQLRRKYRIRLPDAIIWGTAQANEAILITRNTKDFNPDWGASRSLILYSPAFEVLGKPADEAGPVFVWRGLLRLCVVAFARDRRCATRSTPLDDLLYISKPERVKSGYQ